MAGNNGNQNQQNQNSGQQKSGLSWSQPQSQMLGQKPTGGNTPSQAPKIPMTPPVKSNSGSKTTTFVIAAIVVIVIVGGIVISQRKKTESDVALTATTTEDGASTDATSSMKTPNTDNSSVAGNVALSAPTATPTSPSTMKPSETTTSSGSGVTVTSPQSAGMQVEVSNFTASVPTWVIVYEDHNGQPGNVLGAGLFGIGPTSGMVELLRATTPGSTYYVSIAKDDGDRVFSMKSDMAIRDTNGNLITTQFKTN